MWFTCSSFSSSAWSTVIARSASTAESGVCRERGGSSPRAGSLGRSAEMGISFARSLRRQQLPQDILQDAAMLVIAHLLRRIDADGGLKHTFAAVRAACLDRDLASRGETALQ